MPTATRTVSRELAGQRPQSRRLRTLTPRVNTDVTEARGKSRCGCRAEEGRGGLGVVARGGQARGRREPARILK